MKALRFFNKYIFPICLIALGWYMYGPLLAFIILLCFLAYWIWKGRKAFFVLFANQANRRYDFKKSARWFEKAYQLNTANYELASNAAYMYLRTNNFKKAKQLIETINPKELRGEAKIKATSNIAIILWKSGDLDKAVNLFEELLSEGLTSTSLYGNLPYLLLLQGKLDRAYEIALAAFEYNGEDTAIIENLARIYHLKNDIKNAEELYDKMITKKPTYPEAWYNLGLFRLDKGDVVGAKEAFEKSLKCNFTFLSNITAEMVSKELEKIKDS